MSGVSVTALLNGTQNMTTATTGADGSYTLTGLDAGAGAPYSLSFTDSSGSYLPLNYDADPSTPKVDMVKVVAGQTTTANAVLRAAATLSGTVTNSAGAALPGITVTARLNGSAQSQITTTTAADGAYAFAGLDAGAGAQYSVHFSDPSGNYLPLDYDADPSTPATADMVTVVAGKTATANAVLRHSATLSGAITNSAGAGLPGIAVTARPNGSAQGQLTTTTAADGSYAFNSLDVGAGAQYALSFSDPSGDYLPLAYDADPSTPATPDMVTVAAGGTTTASAVLRYACTLSGVVTDSRTDQPVAGVKVWPVLAPGRATAAQSDLPSAVTDATGAYTMSGIPDGTYVLVCDGQPPVYRMQYWTGTAATSTTPDTATPIALTPSATTAVANVVLLHDATRPTTAALNTITMRTRDTAKLKFHVADAYGGSAKLTLIVATATGKVKARASLGVRLINITDSVKWRPVGFSAGKYTWWLTATDLAGNTQSKIVKKAMTLTR